MGGIKRTLYFILNHPLGKRHPFKALWQFLYWQLQCRFSRNKFIVKPFINDVKFKARKGLTGITGNIYTGLHEFNDMAFLLHFLRPADVFFDVGANVGSYTLLASGVCHSKTVAIEPAKITASILQQNIILNQLADNVTLINAAAGAIEGVLNFSQNEDTTNHILSAGERARTDNEIVNVVVIDGLSSTDSPALIKIDVEGFETEVLNGMPATLKLPSLKAIIIELNGSGGRYGFNEQDIHQLLLDSAFKPYLYDPFNRQITLVDTFGDFNTIYCRDIEFINERLKFAEKFEIMGELI
jgi:FkbM family methyltransferase